MREIKKLPYKIHFFIFILAFKAIKMTYNTYLKNKIQNKFDFFFNGKLYGLKYGYKAFLLIY